MAESKTIDDHLELAAQHVERNGLAIGKFVQVEPGKGITECRACMDGAYAIVRGAAHLDADSESVDGYVIYSQQGGYEAEDRMAAAIRRDTSPAPRDEVILSIYDTGVIYRFSDWCATNLPDAEARAAVAAKLRASISKTRSVEA